MIQVVYIPSLSETLHIIKCFFVWFTKKAKVQLINELLCIDTISRTLRKMYLHGDIRLIIMWKITFTLHDKSHEREM